ncbi:MAG: PAS domain S-box protein [Geobacter sp.]|nr:PAS domain S-box protein [Geobacter sp.]
MKQKTADSNVSADGLTAGLAEIKTLLTRLSEGDTALRIEVDSEKDVFGDLKMLIRKIAEYIQDTNNYAHEMAIGLCEHYDTLNRISKGDFAVRSPVDSANELVAKLGELINKEADVLTSAVSRAKLAEEDRNDQLHLLQTLMDTIPNPVFYKDSNCRYLGCNKAFEAYFGLSREMLVGKEPHDLWPVELAELYRQQDQELLTNPGLQTYETTVKYADGTLRDVIFNKATFNEGGGSVSGLVGVILDITERKQAESALAFQNILLSAQQEASIDGLLVVDTSARILSFNRRFREIMDIPPHMLEAGADEAVLAYVTGRMADPEKFLEKVKYLYENSHLSCRDELYLSNGKILDRYTVPLTGEDGHSYGRLWSFRDITERKAAEQETRNAYQQLSDIVEFLPDATFVVDKDKRVIAWNRAIEEMTGLKKGDVIGQGDYVYSIPFYGERRPILIDLIDEDAETIRRKYDYIVMEDGNLFAETYIPSFQNGEARYFWGAATPLFDSHGNRSGGIESIRDITKYKHAEEEKIRLSAQLEHAHMMETLMSRLGHDLKTPLTPLLVMLPLLKKQLAGSDLVKKVDLCISSVTSIKNLSEKTRVIAGLSNAVSAYELEVVNLASIADRAVSECANMISRKPVDCRNNIDPAIVIRAVSEQLQELFFNLLSNAVHFSRVNGIIVISAERKGETLLVSVQDQGIGLSADDMKHVFDDFFKVDESRHDLNASGLGLSICKRIVRNHNGRIWAESPGLDQGTTIKFTLNEKINGDSM